MTRRTRLSSLVVMAVFLPVFAASASEGKHEPTVKKDEHQGASAAETELKTADDLKEEIKALRRRVAALEAMRPSFTGFMPDFAERFHVVHRSGEAGDWAVANHELSEMNRLIGVAMVIDAKNGALLKSFMSANFKNLDEAIEHGNLDDFNKEVAATVKSCNACHAATGSAFVQVTLDVDKSLSLRHPHAFDKTKVPKEHGH